MPEPITDDQRDLVSEVREALAKATPPPYERPKPSAPPATREQIRAIREAARLSKEELHA